MARAARLRLRIKGTNIVGLYQPDNVANRGLLEAARTLSEDDDTDGYFIMTWDERGKFRIGYRCGEIPPRLAAALVCQVASSELSSVQAFKENFEWVT